MPRQQSLYKNRCSPVAIAKVMKKLENRREIDIRRAGFGFVYDLPEVGLDLNFIKDHVMTAYLPVLGHFDQQKLLPSDVRVVFGLPDSGETIPDISKDSKAQLKRRWGNETLRSLKNYLCRNPNADDFMKAFVLFVLGNFLCPTSKEKPSHKLLRVLPIISNNQTYNWAEFVLKWTITESDKYHKNTRKKNIGGCTYFLMILFLQKLTNNPRVPGEPLVKSWTKELITKTVKIPLGKTKLYQRPREYHYLDAEPVGASPQVILCVDCKKVLEMVCDTCQAHRETEEEEEEEQDVSTPVFESGHRRLTHSPSPPI